MTVSVFLWQWPPKKGVQMQKNDTTTETALFCAFDTITGSVLFVIPDYHNVRDDNLILIIGNLWTRLL